MKRCRSCGCTDDDCTLCSERTGAPCSWAEPSLCSACLEPCSLLVYRPPEASSLSSVVLDARGPVLDLVGARGQYLADLDQLGDHLIEVLDGESPGLWQLTGRILTDPDDEDVEQDPEYLWYANAGPWTATRGKLL